MEYGVGMRLLQISDSNPYASDSIFLKIKRQIFYITITYL